MRQMLYLEKLQVLEHFHQSFFTKALTFECFFFVFWFFGGFFGCTMQYVGSQLPGQGFNPGPLQWRCKILTTGPCGSPQRAVFFKQNGTNFGKPRVCTLIYTDKPKDYILNIEKYILLTLRFQSTNKFLSISRYYKTKALDEDFLIA